MPSYDSHCGSFQVHVSIPGRPKVVGKFMSLIVKERVHLFIKCDRVVPNQDAEASQPDLPGQHSTQTV